MKNVHEIDILNLSRHQIYPKGDRLRPEFFVERTPIMDQRTPVGSIGSCFAGTLKNFLIEAGFNYVQTSEEPAANAGSAAWGTVYNTFCIEQEFFRAAWGVDYGFRPVEEEWDDGSGGFLDPYRKRVEWRSREAARAEREQHAYDALSALERADVFVLTAGLTEVWYSRIDGSVFFQVPPAHVFDPEKHGFRVSTVGENVANLEAAYRHLKSRNPGCRVIVTVSPVPLRATFRPLNVVVANARSKATLLAATQAFADAHDDVHYFPSYEIVTVASGSPYRPDNRHVKREVVKRVMEIFVETFVR